MCDHSGVGPMDGEGMQPSTGVWASDVGSLPSVHSQALVLMHLSSWCSHPVFLPGCKAPCRSRPCVSHHPQDHVPLG